MRQSLISNAADSGKSKRVIMRGVDGTGASVCRPAVAFMLTLDRDGGLLLSH